MNTLMKTLTVMQLGIASGYATTITFNGCSNTLNDYFSFTSDGNSEYCIAKCYPKLNPDTETIVTLIIPGKVDNSQVNLGEQAFDWENYTNFANLKVNLVFQAVDGVKVQMPAICDGMFKESSNKTGIKKISIDLTGIESSGITSTQSMFLYCSNLESIDVSNFDTSNVTDMEKMFYFCYTITSLDLSRLDTSKVMSMSSMLYGCTGLTSLDISNFDTSNVTDMKKMFGGCKNLTSLNVSHFNTSKVTTMSQMFERCSKVTSLNVSNFDTSNVTDMEAMFYFCSAITSLDLSKFNTSKVTTMCEMFAHCSSITSLDLSTFDTSNLTSMKRMFLNCAALENLELSSKFSVPSEVTDMFTDCKEDLKITGICGSGFNTTENPMKNTIAPLATTVYALIPSDLKAVVESQLPQATFEVETDYSNLFESNSDDAVYIGMDTEAQTITVDGDGKTIAGALINTSIDDIEYYPANLRLTGTISLSGDNTEFEEGVFIIGDGVKDTTITFTNPNAFPRTDTTVESGGTLVLAGTENYTLSNNITIKSGGKFNATQRVILSGNGVTLKFEN